MGGKTVGRGLPLRLVSATQPRSGAARAGRGAYAASTVGDPRHSFAPNREYAEAA